MRRSTKGTDLGAAVVIGLVAFGTSLVWYSPFLFGNMWMDALGAEAEMPGWEFAFAPLREIVSAGVLLFLVRRVRPVGWTGAVGLGLVLWLGFYVVQLTGAVIFDDMPWQVGAVHAGDWLMKTLLMTSSVRWWDARQPRAGERAVLAES